MSISVLILGHATPLLRSLTTLLGGLPVSVNSCESVDGSRVRQQSADAALTVFEYSGALSDGRTVTAILAACPDRPVLAVGPDYSEKIRHELTEFPRVHFMPMSSPTGEKLGLIRRLLGLTVPKQLKVGPLLINPAEGTAHCHHQPLHLTITEFHMLHTLMSSPGQQVSVAALTAATGSRAVNLHAVNLRRKLAEHALGGVLKGDGQNGYLIDARHAARRTPNPASTLRRHLLRL